MKTKKCQTCGRNDPKYANLWYGHTKSEFFCSADCMNYWKVMKHD